MCTATMVSDNTLITAAHCIDNFRQRNDGSIAGRVCIQTGALRGVCSTDVHFPREYNQPGGLRNAFDIAVAIFPQGSFKQYHEVETIRPNVGEPIMLTGYSGFVNGRNIGAGPTKRWGYTRISNFLSDITIVSQGNRTVNGVAVSPGDSGGPAFHQCKLFGVASRMSLGSVKQSLHTNVTYPGVSQWMKGLESKGAYFCGFSGQDTQRSAANQKYVPITEPRSGAFPCGLTANRNEGTPPNAPSPNTPIPNRDSQQFAPSPAPSNSVVPSPVAPGRNQCACGVAPNRFGTGCVVERANPNPGQMKILVQNGSSSMCQTEDLCKTNFGDYLNNRDFCPDGWFFGRASLQGSPTAPQGPGPQPGSIPPAQQPPNPGSRPIGDSARVEYQTSILPIIQRNCSECHHPGTRLNLMSADVAADPRIAARIVELVGSSSSYRMPPAPRERVPAAETELLRRWANIVKSN
jgi:hypothetical protein